METALIEALAAGAKKKSKDATKPKPMANQKMKTVKLKKGHLLLGTWAYQNTYSREFTEDGRCILRNNGEVISQRSRRPQRRSRESILMCWREMC